MDVVKTIQFILELSAKTEQRFAQNEEQFAKIEQNFDRLEENFVRAEARADRADRRMDRLEASLAQTIRVVKLMVRAGRPLRSDIRRLQQSQEKSGEKLSEIDGKLDALIDIVDQSIRRNGGKSNH